MPKFIMLPKMVINLGGYIIENRADLGYRDVLVGNPKDECVKIYVPIYSEQNVIDIEKLGLIVHRLSEEEDLVEELEIVKKKVEERPF
ncbi:MAG TPA: energy-converting hydrogenase B subunit EhbP [Candidatus Methanofastidiosa archaeon]|nr:energy-converting hydrogenase B subunit EhbP [Candidatus Methanofastidiosa archaeon]